MGQLWFHPIMERMTISVWMREETRDKLETNDPENTFLHPRQLNFYLCLSGAYHKIDKQVILSDTCAHCEIRDAYAENRR